MAIRMTQRDEIDLGVRLAVGEREDGLPHPVVRARHPGAQ
jgi:hypothetical protein